MREGAGRHSADEVEILARIARVATEDQELGAMFPRLVDALAELLDWDHVALMRVDRRRRRWVCEAFASRVPTEVDVGFARPLGSGVIGRVAETGVPVSLDDTAIDPDFVDTLYGARSELCVPVRHRGEVVALLNLESLRPAAFAGQLPLVEAIAAQISGAVANLLHHDEVRRQASAFATLTEVSKTALEDEHLDSALDRVAEYLQQRFDHYLVAIVVADEGGREWAHRAFATRDPIELELPSRWSVERGVVGRAIRTGEPQFVADVSKDRDYFGINEAVVSEFVVPIRHGSRVLGAINLESDRPGEFPREHRELMELVADQVAGAIRFALVNRNLSETKRQLQEANRRLEKLSTVDPLTGVANRRRFDEALELEWRRLARAERPLSLLLLDVDRFKSYNDGLGHLEGDRCLVRIGRLLVERGQRAGDLVARYGGEEFAILLGSAGSEAAQQVAESLRADLEGLSIPHPASDVARVVTVSVGAATVVPRRGGSPLELIAAADEALYRAKREGRNRVRQAGAGGIEPEGGLSPEGPRRPGAEPA